MTPDIIRTKEETKSVSLFRTLVISFSLVAILSCMAIGVLTYYLRSKEIRKDQYSILETLRDEKIRSLTVWFAERSGDIRIMVTRPDIVSYCKIKHADGFADQDQAQAVLMTMQKAYRYEAVFLTDAQGRLIASTETEVYTPGSLPIREATLQRTIKEKHNIVSDVLISKVHKKEALFLFAPVFEPGSSDLVGVLGILVDPTVWLYPQFTHSAYLGDTGEMLLVNAQGLAQSPLKYKAGSVATMTIHAEPATRGASGEFGIIAVEDYRQEAVMAAYGYIRDFKWGIVVKRDMAEINLPVRRMAGNVAIVSFGVLVCALMSGVFISRRISLPALRIANVAAAIGAGDLDARVSNEGPAEIRRIAVNLNAMVEQLSLRVKVTREVGRIVSVAGKHNNISDLLEEVLTVFMEVTRSQMGVVFLADESGNRLDQMLVHGFDSERIAKQLAIKPPDHLLAKSLASDQVDIFLEIPENNDMTIDTQLGEVVPRALLSVPLNLRDRPIGVIGLASLYDYDDAAQQIADDVRSSLSQAIEICLSFEQSERMGSELDERNQELTVINEELQAKSEELEHQADELRSLASELEAQREEVSRADRLKSEFLSNMSHELRTPLNSVLSLSQLMLSNGIGAAGGEDKERLEIIERNGRQLLSLINDILDLSKIESGKMDLYVSLFDVSEVIDSTVAAIRPLAKEKDLAVKVEVADMDAMQSDKGKIQQIILNLLSNAQKFTEKGEIGIKIQQAGNTVVFKIWDTGKGIPSDELPHIFNEFIQVDGSTTRQYGGTGLGLTICQRLASLLGGRVDVESEEGKGSTFTVTLPMVIEAQDTDAQQDLTVESISLRKWQPGAEPPRILVVEDEEVAAEQVTMALRTAGFVVDITRNGEMAQASVRENIPDGIVLDLMMPVIDGFQVLNDIRSAPRTENLPVLVLTAKDLTAEERSILARNNVKQLLQKGRVDREQLVDNVRLLVGMQLDRTPEVKPDVTPKPRVKKSKGEQVTILVVEDNPDNMKVAKGILSGMDVDVLEAHEGREAVETAKEKRPDIILMDINLPGMSGLEATDEIKRDSELKDIVIIALTAKAMIGDREEILAAGCDDYLSKPVNPAILKSTIQKWIDGEAS